MRKKIVGILVIILFLVVAFAPGITASREIVETNELNSDLVEIIVEVGKHDHKVLLTPKQAMELESLIDQMKTRLDAATTWEDTSQIFDETVVSLYELGMLPDEMSIEDVQRMVKSNNRFPMREKLLNRLSGRNFGIFDDDENRFCLIAGQTGHTLFRDFIVKLLDLHPELFGPFLIFGGMFCFLYWVISLLRPEVFPLVVGNSILLGYSFSGPNGISWSPAHGWIHTFGLNGVKNWDGDLLGNYAKIHFWVEDSYYGIMGFTGIRIRLNEDSTFRNYYYLGTARHVKIKYFNPA